MQEAQVPFHGHLYSKKFRYNRGGLDVQEAQIPFHGHLDCRKFRYLIMETQMCRKFGYISMDT